MQAGTLETCWRGVDRRMNRLIIWLPLFWDGAVLVTALLDLSVVPALAAVMLSLALMGAVGLRIFHARVSMREDDVLVRRWGGLGRRTVPSKAPARGSSRGSATSPSGRTAPSSRPGRRSMGGRSGAWDALDLTAAWLPLRQAAGRGVAAPDQALRRPRPHATEDDRPVPRRDRGAPVGAARGEHRERERARNAAQCSSIRSISFIQARAGGAAYTSRSSSSELVRWENGASITWSGYGVNP